MINKIIQKEAIIIMTKPRPKPYVWITWLTKLMAGENQCYWASWFKSHNQYDKLPSDFDLVKWTADHNRLLNSRAAALAAKGYTVTIENQNSFKLTNTNGVTVAGKADIVYRDYDKDEIWVEDIKTGKQRNSDQIQVALYMFLLPYCLDFCKGKTLQGRVIYKDREIIIPSVKVDESFKKLFAEAVAAVAQSKPGKKVPSLMECRWCDIPKTICTERMEYIQQSFPI